MRYVAALLAAWLVAGCARDVLMLDPRTGETARCRASSLNPWSQEEACVGGHIANGWRRVP
jgi:hypothetical protein